MCFRRSGKCQYKEHTPKLKHPIGILPSARLHDRGARLSADRGPGGGRRAGGRASLAGMVPLRGKIHALTLAVFAFATSGLPRAWVWAGRREACAARHGASICVCPGARGGQNIKESGPGSTPHNNKKRPGSGYLRIPSCRDPLPLPPPAARALMYSPPPSTCEVEGAGGRPSADGRPWQPRGPSPWPRAQASPQAHRPGRPAVPGGGDQLSSGRPSFFAETPFPATPGPGKTQSGPKAAPNSQDFTNTLCVFWVFLSRHDSPPPPRPRPSSTSSGA